jgi:hypothetical protein
MSLRFLPAALLAMLMCVCVSCDDKKTDSAAPAGGNSQNAGETPAADPTPQPPPVLAKLKLTREGELMLDGKQVSLDDLKARFEGLKGKDGVVLFFKERNGNPQSGVTMKALQQLAEKSSVSFKPTSQDFGSGAPQ